MQHSITAEIAALMAEHLAEGVIITVDARPVFANQAIVSELGYQKASDLPDTLSGLIHPDDRREMMELYARKMAGDPTPPHKLFRMLTATGETYWVKSRSTVVEWNGRPALLSYLHDVSEEVKTQQNLDDSRRLYKELFESFNDIFYRTDLEGRLTIISPSVSKHMGWRPEEVVGTRLADYYVDPERRQELLDLLARHGAVEAFQAPVYHKDGSEVWLSSNVSFWRDREGKVAGVQGVSRDMRQQRKAEAALVRERDRAQTFLDTAQVILLALNREGRVELINRKGAEVLDYQAKDLMGKNWFETCLPPEQRPVMQAFFDQLISAEVESKAAYRENPVITRSGEQRIIRWRSTLLTDDRGSITGTLSSGEDITEQRLAETALMESQNRLQLLLDSVPVGVYELDATGIITMVNQSFARITEYESHELMGMAVWDLMEPGPQRDSLPDHFHFLAEHRPPPSPFYCRDLTKSGRAIDVEVEWRYKLDEQGKVAGFFCSINDISDRLASNLARQRLEAQLRQAKKMEALGTLAGGIAHDFNNLLGAIMGFTELAQEEAAMGRDAAKELGEVLKASERAKDLVRQVLTFSRNYQSKPCLMDLNQEVEQAARLLSRTLPKMVSIITKPCPSEATVKADPNRVEQILLNLGSNAADAMPDGGELTIAVERFHLRESSSGPSLEMQPGDYVLLSVSDTGCGMDSATSERVFDPFFTTKERGRGTGLGLSSVYGIVKEHGAHLQLHTRPGQGTRVEIYFPLAEGQPQATDSRPAAPTELPRGNGETILLVDDEHGIRELGMRMLNGAGYRVLLADSGETALEQYRKHGETVSLVVMDLGMPGMGGVRCLERLGELDPKVKVIVATGYLPSGPMREHLQNHTVALVEKPFRLAELLATIKDSLV